MKVPQSTTRAGTRRVTKLARQITRIAYEHVNCLRRLRLHTPEQKGELASTPSRRIVQRALIEDGFQPNLVGMLIIHTLNDGVHTGVQIVHAVG